MRRVSADDAAGSGDSPGSDAARRLRDCLAVTAVAAGSAAAFALSNRMWHALQMCPGGYRYGFPLARLRRTGHSSQSSLPAESRRGLGPLPATSSPARHQAQSTNVSQRSSERGKQQYTARLLMMI
jgi:hypothetical protein